MTPAIAWAAIAVTALVGVMLSAKLAVDWVGRWP